MIPARLQRGQATPIRCARYRVTITDRRTNTDTGTCPLDRGNVAALAWHWTLNATSTCDLVVAFNQADDEGRPCCDCDVRPWRDVVTIERVAPDGATEGVVWQGPVTNSVEDGPSGTMIISASDWSIDAARRPEARTAVPAGLDEADLWYRLFTGALAGGFGGINPIGWRQTGRTHETAIDAASATKQGTDTADYLFGNNLQAVQWTVVGRDLYGPGPNTVGETVWAELHTSTDWDGQPKIERDGTYTASQVRLVGVPVPVVDKDGKTVTTDSEVRLIGIYPPQPLVDDINGLHILTIEVDGTWTQANLDAAAKARWVQSRDGDMYLITGETSLTTDAPVTVWDLIPGRRFRVVADTTCTGTAEVLQVFNVVVEAVLDEDGWLLENRVAVDFNRPGSTTLPFEQLSI